MQMLGKYCNFRFYEYRHSPLRLLLPVDYGLCPGLTLSINYAVQLNLSASMHKLVSLAQSTCSRWVQVRTLGSSILPRFSHAFTTSGVCFGYLSCWNTQSSADDFRFLLLHYSIYFR